MGTLSTVLSAAFTSLVAWLSAFDSEELPNKFGGFFSASCRGKVIHVHGVPVKTSQRKKRRTTVLCCSCRHLPLLLEIDSVPCPGLWLLRATDGSAGSPRGVRGSEPPLEPPQAPVVTPRLPPGSFSPLIASFSKKNF